MNITIRYIVIAIALAIGLASGGALNAQISAEIARGSRPVLAVPIRVVAGQIIEVPSEFMRMLSEAEPSDLIEVLDLSVEVSSRVLDAFPPSRQPLLHIGRNTYPVQRVEFSNWDALEEKPMDKALAVGEMQTVHFFIEHWREVERGQLMILSVLSSEEIWKATDGQFDEEQFKRLMPETTQEIPRYAPREFLELLQEK